MYKDEYLGTEIQLMIPDFAPENNTYNMCWLRLGAPDRVTTTNDDQVLHVSPKSRARSRRLSEANGTPPPGRRPKPEQILVNPDSSWANAAEFKSQTGVFFRFTNHIRVEGFRQNRFLLFRIAVDVEQHSQEAGSMIPVVFAPGFGHHQQFPQRERGGIYPEDAGEFIDESIYLVT